MFVGRLNCNGTDFLYVCVLATYVGTVLDKPHMGMIVHKCLSSMLKFLNSTYHLCRSANNWTYSQIANSQHVINQMKEPGKKISQATKELTIALFWLLRCGEQMSACLSEQEVVLVNPRKHKSYALSISTSSNAHTPHMAVLTLTALRS